ncbi:MAG: hypothetical protein LUE29_09680 [Lachnospiraceae bacterium]|nr:hypothetical protein [Lachnospiraceae bacterium]
MALFAVIAWLIETLFGIGFIMSGTNLAGWNDFARVGIGALFLIAAAINLTATDND